MAIIKCPECGKEISDQVKNCPNCGYPVKRKNVKKIWGGVVCLVLVGIIGGVVYHQTIAKPRKLYDEAVTLFNAEKYDEASELFAKILEYKDVSEYLKQIESEKVYQEAIVFYENGEYDVANELFANISEYKDVKNIQKQMEDDRAYNRYIDDAIRYMFFAEGAVNEANEVLDDVTSIWYNSIYEEDGSFTDEYTKGANGEFFDDFNTALFLYYSDETYERAEERIVSNQSIADEYYSKLKDAPEELKDFSEKISTVQTACAGMVDFALNTEGNYSSVTETWRQKKDEFNVAYRDAEFDVPEKKTIIEKRDKEEKHDFRAVDFGMTMDEVIAAEKDNYSLEGYNMFSELLIFENVEIEGGYLVDISYGLDETRVLSHIMVQLEEKVTEDEKQELISIWYGDDFDGHTIIEERVIRNIVKGHNQYPFLEADILKVDVKSIFIQPLTQEDYEVFYGGENKTETIVETEKNTETEVAAEVAEKESETVSEIESESETVAETEIETTEEETETNTETAVETEIETVAETESETGSEAVSEEEVTETGSENATEMEEKAVVAAAETETALEIEPGVASETESEREKTVETETATAVEEGTTETVSEEMTETDSEEEPKTGELPETEIEPESASETEPESVSETKETVSEEEITEESSEKMTETETPAATAETQATSEESGDVATSISYGEVISIERDDEYYRDEYNISIDDVHILSEEQTAEIGITDTDKTVVSILCTLDNIYYHGYVDGARVNFNIAENGDLQVIDEDGYSIDHYDLGSASLSNKKDGDYPYFIKIPAESKKRMALLFGIPEECENITILVGKEYEMSVNIPEKRKNSEL